ncbi:hypothetical protein EPUS_02855 [Endocarpon pusillum Z07020]|uniref:AB hydrolase-1 domain-containing protein n=1 Tax=Endocarpon pusillum (strain Z07020 / HMAS-L-300199) TaxID=1263415 RepID=U1GK65_ENDPU|nr:uncharacterized protein EPUS_02855 [Endocarpon pusillum Z07020]ERF72573.1 hypothetical protein EPUS_02855 [Endocarpon pusillum Z07020]
MADTVIFSPLPDMSQPDGADAVMNFFGALPDILANNPHQQTSGTYNITATYCPPEGGILPDRNEVQLLVHGATYTKEYWMGGAWHGSDDYSWTKQANKAGYGTLAIDRLGNGASEHPDPLQVVQLTLQTEVLNVVAQKIQSGEITGSPSKVIYVGHSLGSILGTMLANRYPNSIDKLVLTGYTSDASNVAPTVVAGQYLPAQNVEPARFSSLPQGYSTQSIESGRTLLSYAGDFDPSIPPLDFCTKGTLGLGEILGVGSAPASIYQGPVFILTGDKDEPFCGTNPNAPCEPLIQATALEFPRASTFGYFMPRNTGHGLNFHYTASESFAAVTKWLNSESNASFLQETVKR